MDIKEIQNLIKFVAKSGASEVKLEMDEVKITIRTESATKNETTTTIVQAAPNMAQMPMVAQAPVTPAAPAAVPAVPVSNEKENNEEANYLTIKSPIIGTFYRRPSPDKPMFAEVGKEVKEGDTVCVIEAMKLFNEIESEVSGKIVKILVDDATPVEFDQPLFLVDPS